MQTCIDDLKHAITMFPFFYIFSYFHVVFVHVILVFSSTCSCNGAEILFPGLVVLGREIQVKLQLHFLPFIVCLPMPVITMIYRSQPEICNSVKPLALTVNHFILIFSHFLNDEYPLAIILKTISIKYCTMCVFCICYLNYLYRFCIDLNI